MEPGLLAARPSRAKGVDEIDLPGSGTILKSPATGVLLELQPWERDLWQLLDGSRTVRELITAGLLLPRPIGPSRIGQALQRFGRAGFLGPEFRATERAPGPAVLSISLPQPTGATRALGAAAAGALVVLPLVLGLPALFRALRDGGLAVVQPDGSPFVALLTLAGFAWFRAACQAMAALSCGLRLSSAGVDLRIGLPLPHLDLSRLEMADRKHQVWVALSGLWSPLALACAICLADGQSVFARQAAAIGLLFVLADLSPLFEWNGYRLYRAAFDTDLVRDRALAFFARRFFVRALPTGEQTEEQKRLTTYGLAVLVWAASVLKLAAAAFRASAVPVVMAVFRSGSFPVQTLLLFVLMMSGALLLYTMLRVLWIPVVLLGDETRREVVSRLTVPVAVLASAAGLLWDAPVGQVLLHVSYAALLVGVWHRYRDCFAGTSLTYAFDFLVGYVAFRSVLLLPAALLESSATVLGFEIAPGHQHALDGLGAALALAAPFFFRHAFIARLKRGEIAFSLVSAGIVLAVSIPAWQRGASATALLEYAGILLSTLAIIQLLLVDNTGPFVRVWWLIYAGFVAFTAASTIQIFGGAAGEVNAATLPLQTAAVLPIAAGIFAGGYLLGGPFRGRERRPRPGPAVAAEVAELLFETLGDVARRVLGERRGSAALDVRAGGSPRERYGELVGSLERHGGRAFRQAAEHAAASGLYWPEWSVAQTHVYSRGPQEDVATMLAAIPFFARLTEEELRRVSTILKREPFLPRQRVATRGEQGDKFYVVRSGELEVLLPDAAGVERPVARLIQGDCFDELALLPEGGGVRTASVDALTPVELLSMGRAELAALLPDQSAIVSVIHHGGFLRRVPLLAPLPPAVLSRLAARLTAERPDEPAMLLVREGNLEGTVWNVECLVGDNASGPVPEDTGLWLKAADFQRELDAYLAPVRGLDDLSRSRGV